MKKLLLVNDDGIHAPGLAALQESVRGKGEVETIAPHLERSGMGHAISVHQPLRLTKLPQGYMLDGTPADCVKMALEGLGLQPDFVLSGINSGANLGTDVLYSGTVAAATEGVLAGIPSLAISLCGSEDFMATAAEVVRELLFVEPGFIIRPDLIPKTGMLNINIPALPKKEIKGVRLTRLGVRKYSGLMEKRQDPRGNHYYWMGGKPLSLGSSDWDIDLVAVDQGYISITPLQFDLTYYEELSRLKRELNQL